MRHQKVLIDNIKANDNLSSSWEQIKDGIPQDFILGPFFFLLYINNLPKIAAKDTKIVLYADDTRIIVTNTNSNKQNINRYK
jgi:hypothetical protein